MNKLYKLEMNNHSNILDLPDEILLIILCKLNRTLAIYSLMDVNQRFRRLVLDTFYIRDFNMTNAILINSLYNHTSSIDTQVLSRIYSKILPRVQHQIQKLTIEEFSVEQVFHVSNYPQLYSLSLINFRVGTLYQHLKGIEFYFIFTIEKKQHK